MKDIYITNKNIVLTFNHPSWQRNSHAHFLFAIWMAVQLEVLANGLIGQGLVCFCELDIMTFNLFFGLAFGKDEFIGVEFDGETLVVFLDLLFSGRSSNA